MHDATNFELAFYGVMLTVVVVMSGFQVRFYLRRFLGRRWPTKEPCQEERVRASMNMRLLSKVSNTRESSSS